MYFERVGVPFWMASLVILAALAVFSTPAIGATTNSRCLDKAMNDMMKHCSTVGTKHKRSVGKFDTERENAARFLLPETADLPIQMSEPEIIKEYMKRELQQSDSDVAVPLPDNEPGQNNESDERGPSPGIRSAIIRHLVHWVVGVVDDPELNPLNEEELDNTNNLLYERSPRGYKEEIIKFLTSDDMICCKNTFACRKKIYFMCSRK